MMTEDFLKAIGCRAETLSQIQTPDRLEKFIKATLRRSNPIFLITEVIGEGAKAIPLPFNELDRFGQKAVIVSVYEHIQQAAKTSQKS